MCMHDFSILKKCTKVQVYLNCFLMFFSISVATRVGPKRIGDGPSKSNNQMMRKKNFFPL